MADELDDNGLSLEPQRIEKDHAWYYEEKGGLYVYIGTSGNPIRAVIPWRKVVKSVERYQAGKARKVVKSKAKGK